jgi:hypothetical protein
MPMAERVASAQTGKDSAMCEELQELKDENERLRKSLTLLHAHSLRIQDQLDALLGGRNTSLDACGVVASWVPEDRRADEYPGALAGQLDSALCELTNEPEPDGWTTMTASAGIAG